MAVAPALPLLETVLAPEGRVLSQEAKEGDEVALDAELMDDWLSGGDNESLEQLLGD